MESEEKTPAELPKKKQPSSSANKLVFAVVVLVLLVATAVYVNHIKSSSDNSANTTQTTAEVPNFSLSPSKQSLKVGDPLTVSVWEDSGSQEVNAAQVTLSYKPEEFDVASIDATTSAFEIEAPSSNTPGVLVLNRGHNGKLTERQLIAKVTFTAKTESKTADINFTGDNNLVPVSNGKISILEKTTGGTYNIGAKE